MTRLSPFNFTLANGQEATFYAATHSQAVELALTFSRAHGLVGSGEDAAFPAPEDRPRQREEGLRVEFDERDRVAWNLPPRAA